MTTYDEQYITARHLVSTTLPVQVKFAGGWRDIHKVEKAPRNPRRPDLPKIGLYNQDGGLVAWFYADSTVYIRRAK